MTNFESGCCRAEIFQADKNGHGHCMNCGEHCTPFEDDVYDKIEDKQDAEIEAEYNQYLADRLGGGNVVDVRDTNSGTFAGDASVGKQVYEFLKRHGIRHQVLTNGGKVTIWINPERGQKVFS